MDDRQSTNKLNMQGEKLSIQGTQDGYFDIEVLILNFRYSIGGETISERGKIGDIFMEMRIEFVLWEIIGNWDQDANAPFPFPPSPY